ncbi:MAG: hypothetical protein M1832_003209 [Thelocarpon impressellum]|nr:MAG: hypothetical protein M1832_003209 [Thelocarpon impressellum]
MAPSVEISIPNTTTSTSAKSFTLYNIALRLPLRSFTVLKRYSDFTGLHQALTSQAGSAPPAELPQKSWFTRTTSSPQLTEERRKGLEAYLRAINESEDGRWRSTSAWRGFLNLPSSAASANSSSAASSLHGSMMSPAGGGAPITDSAVWLDCHRDLKTQLHDARLHLQRRDQAETAQGQHESSAAAKRCLVKAGAMITALEQGLKTLVEAAESSWGSNKLGAGEVRRRRDLLSSARKEKEGLETLANSLATKNAPSSVANGGALATVQDKTSLFGGPNGSQQTIGSRSGRVLGAPLPETEHTRELDNNGVLQLQKQLMEDQDLSVEQLGKGISRLKELGVAINGELQVQNGTLKLLDEDAERLQGKVNVAKKRVGKIS